MNFAPRAWIAWWAATLVTTSLLDSPAVAAVIIAACVYVGAAFELPDGEGRAYRVMLRVGLILLGVRVVLFGLAGHTGPTELARLPELHLPGVLGGFTFGGRITAEVLAQEFAEGLRVAAVLVACGALLSVVPVSAMLRLLPARLRSAGLILTIAVTFVPHLASQARRVREAQRMRGARTRGVAALRGVIGPVVGGAVERSFDLAASMESRGYGGGRPTRRHPERSTPYDRALIAVAGCVAAGAVLLRGAGGARWYAHPVVTMPAVDARVVAVACAVAAPVWIAGMRARRLVRASAPREVPHDVPREVPRAPSVDVPSEVRA